MSRTQITVGPIATRDIRVVTIDSVSGVTTFYESDNTEDGVLKITFNSDSTPVREMNMAVSKGDPRLPHRVYPKCVDMGCEPVAPSPNVMVQTPSGIMSCKDAAAKYNAFKASVTYTFNNVVVGMAPLPINGTNLYVVKYDSVTPHLTDIEAY